ncbi:tetratricopeptide repeat protein [Undibacterium sp. LX40W]|uniref:Tetratricopeptide repeat protein n=1 Tax=Undibacterium nitidum TaxID=2762298 RepID=A0A923KN71_9BURK|nr:MULTISPECIES: tetratricopeptide repeat protein [Undibacterium]MBC3880323.1 tetratricopeptide repeat protein [Undibacterium nitidum]MBC3890941.1 tetratricopeptide repeat protein [Undibacterium sp. LX40W]
MTNISLQEFNVPRGLKTSLFVTTLLTSLLGMQSAQAHEYSALIKAKKYAEVERAVGVKLASDANNADALVAKVDLILIEAKLARLDEGIKLAEQCITNNPKNSECHEALGNVLGIKAEKGGVMSGIGSLGKIRDAFKKAIELDPKNFSAVNSLMTFYLEVPGFMGGSNSKAKEVIAETQKVSAAVASLLQAKFDLKDEKLEKAKSGVLAVNSAGNPVIAQLQNDIAIEIAQTLVKDKKFLDAEKMFRDIVQRFPESSAAHLGLGRSLQEQGKAKDALPHLEKSLSIDATGAAYYRLGKTWQALGDKTKAISFFEKALAFTPALGTKTRADAEEQIKLLK